MEPADPADSADMDFDDSPHDECGVFGIYAPERDVARLTFFALFALQHRGQESAGIAVSDQTQIMVYKEMGLVSQVFKEQTLRSLSGQMAIGHVRYSTTGSSEWRNAQPIHRARNGSAIALAHNGNLVNTDDLRQQLVAAGVELSST
ncbi:MAG TPA: class II glutamine amidotransferase, partial [Thermoleophilia bacterium]|nr:class II glutamine amidotransferase [Thermoleophilia bacterium]